MGWKEFAASVIGDFLDWPVIVLVIVLILLGPIRRLIGRVKNAEGFGGKLSFELAKVEKDTLEAVAEAKRRRPWWKRRIKVGVTGLGSVEVDTDPKAEPGPEPAPWPPSDIPDDTEFVFDPSGVILKRWDRLLALMVELRDTTLPDEPTYSNSGKIAALQLAKAGYLSEPIFDSFKGLMKIRNEIAHGQANATPAVARTYVENAQKIEHLLHRAISVLAPRS